MKFFYFFLAIIFCQFNFAQEAILLRNPSFEDEPGFGRLPIGWQNCAFNMQSPPDTHPLPNGLFEVRQVPKHGKSFIGLVARDNGTTESFGQQLSSLLQADQCYSFSLYLCRSERLISRSPSTGQLTNYDQPLVLKVWAGHSPCGKKQLLAISPPVSKTTWERFDLTFTPNENFSWIGFEVDYETKKQGFINGNLLIDNALPIIPISCETSQTILNPDTLTQYNYVFSSYQMPHPITQRWYFSAYGSVDSSLGYKIVEDKTSIQRLIKTKIQNFGFLAGSFEFIEGCEDDLKELSINVFHQKNLHLYIGIIETEKKLNKRQLKAVKSLFRTIGLPEAYYNIDITTIFKTDSEDGWICSDHGLCLKIN